MIRNSIKPILTLALVFICTIGWSQDKPVQFSFSKEKTDSGWTVSMKANIRAGAQIFSIKPFSPDAPLNTVISFDSVSLPFVKKPAVENGNSKTEKDSSLNNAELIYFTDSVSWIQPLEIKDGDSAVIRGKITYFVKTGDEYNSYEEPFKQTIVASASAVGNNDSLTENLKNKSLWWIFIASFGGGLLALITPCVFSMIPVTVSFFTKRSKTKQEGIRNAISYSISLILIFTILGLLITLIFGPAALNKMATNWIANLVFFALFLLFGFSFLGAFEIGLPSSWTNKASMKSGTGSFWGIFFMALTLALVSFSCTGPIVGNLIVLASNGSYMGPLVGMFAFSLALALPFSLFALFPGMLNSIGKAGGWLNAVKVTLGFIELALALKFLSNADLSKSWRLLDREVYLALWIVIFALLGLYLLGKLKFHHDDDLPKNDFGHPYLSVTRLTFAIATFSFVVYMIPGLWGAPLKGISAFLPPYGTQDFVQNSGSAYAPVSTAPGVLPPEKYVKQMRIYEPEVVRTAGLVTYYDYDEALAASRASHKPLMLDFTGINCINCRKMEAQVWSDPQVMRRLKENFIVASLFTDVQQIEIPESEEFFSKELNEKVNTVGEKFSHLQVSRYGTLSQPFYIFLDDKEQKLAPDGYPYIPNVQEFVAHLDKVLEEYKKRTGQ
ncbi:MAG: thioredoxin family protein [Chitinophagaceae bacterium]|nr:thioredoxin family protein [Chitinophagaceae bacterium]